MPLEIDNVKRVAGFLESSRVQIFLGGSIETEKKNTPLADQQLTGLNQPPFKRPVFDLSGPKILRAKKTEKVQVVAKKISLPVNENRAPAKEKIDIKKTVVAKNYRVAIFTLMKLWLEKFILKEYNVFPFSPPSRPDALKHLKKEIETIPKDDADAIVKMLTVLGDENALDAYEKIRSMRLRSAKTNQKTAKSIMLDVFDKIELKQAQHIMDSGLNIPAYAIEMESYKADMENYLKDGGEAWEIRQKPGNDMSDEAKYKYVELYLRNLPFNIKTLIKKERPTFVELMRKIESDPSELNKISVATNGLLFRVEDLSDAEMMEFGDLYQDKLVQCMTILRPFKEIKLEPLIGIYEKDDIVDDKASTFLRAVTRNIQFVKHLLQNKNALVDSFAALAEFLPDEGDARDVKKTLLSRAAKFAVQESAVSLKYGLSMPSQQFFQNDYQSAFKFLKDMSKTDVVDVYIKNIKTDPVEVEIPVLEVVFYKTFFPVVLGFQLNEKIQEGKVLFAEYGILKTQLKAFVKQNTAVWSGGEIDISLDLKDMIDIFSQFKNVQTIAVPSKIYNRKQAIVVDVAKYYTKLNIPKVAGVIEGETICVDPDDIETKRLIETHAIEVSDNPCLKRK